MKSDSILNLLQLEVQAVKVGEFCSKKMRVHILVHMWRRPIRDESIICYDRFCLRTAVAPSQGRY